MRTFWGSVLKAGGWRALERLGGRDTMLILQQARMLSALDGEAGDRQRLSLLEGVVESAYALVPFYQRHPSGPCALRHWDDLSRIPVVGKDELKRDARAFVSSRLTGKPGKSVSGGSLGVPVTSYSDPEAASHVKAAIVEGRSWWGIHPWSRCLSVWGHSKYLGAGWRGVARVGRQRVLDALANRRVLSAYDLSIDAVRHFNRVWWRDRPRFIVGYASVLHEIARIHRTLDLPVPERDCVVMSTGEVLHAWQADEIRAIMKCPVVEEYGLVEAGALAYSNPTGEGLKVLASHFVLEVLDDDGRPVTEGEEGRIVVSALRRREVPVLRYDTGDRAVCLDPRGGRNCLRIGKVLGRTYDVIRRADGTPIPGVLFTHAMKPLGQVGRFQVLQRVAGEAEVSYTADTDLPADVIERLQGQVGAELGDHFGISFHRVDALPASKAGKYRWIRSELDPSCE